MGNKGSRYTQQDKNKAFSMYAKGMSFAEIARQMKPTRQTISKWATEGEWRKRNEEANQKVQQVLNETLESIKERQIKICKGVQGSFLRKLKENQTKTKFNDALHAMKHELLLAGEATERTAVEGRSLEEEFRKFQRIKKEENNDD